jgi:hypothetical protein
MIKASEIRMKSEKLKRDGTAKGNEKREKKKKKRERERERK